MQKDLLVHVGEGEGASPKIKPYMCRNGDQSPICKKCGLTVNKRVMVEVFYQLFFQNTGQLYIVTPIPY